MSAVDLLERLLRHDRHATAEILSRLRPARSRRARSPVSRLRSAHHVVRERELQQHRSSLGEPADEQLSRPRLRASTFPNSAVAARSLYVSFASPVTPRSFALRAPATR